MNISKNRIALLDEIRGFCVLCMIFYHSFIFMYEQYDISFGYDAYTFFLPVQPFFSCMFIFICGICCHLSHSNIKRGLKLAVFALALNFVSIIVLPKMGFVGTEIWWGVLDFFTVCILLYAFLEKYINKVPTIIGIAICVGLFWIFRFWASENIISIWGDIEWQVPENWHEVKWLFPLGIQSFDFFSADYFPLIPYGIVFFLGTYVGNPVAAGKVPSFAYPVHSKVLTWLGQNCFLVYIIHLPIVFIILEFYTWIINKI